MRLNHCLFLSLLCVIIASCGNNSAELQRQNDELKAQLQQKAIKDSMSLVIEDLKRQQQQSDSIAFIERQALEQQHEEAQKKQKQQKQQAEYNQPSNAQQQQFFQNATELIMAKNAIAQNWRSYVTTTSHYDANKILGGIKNGTVFITNACNYNVRQVVVKVYYVRANGDICYNYTYTYSNLPANQRAMFQIPDVNCGTKIKTEITSISAPELGL